MNACSQFEHITVVFFCEGFKCGTILASSISISVPSISRWRSAHESREKRLADTLNKSCISEFDVVGKRHPCLGISIVPVEFPLVENFDLPCAEQSRKHDLQHIDIPPISKPGKTLLQFFPRFALSSILLCLMNRPENFKSNGCAGIENIVLPLSNDQSKGILPS